MKSSLLRTLAASAAFAWTSLTLPGAAAAADAIRIGVAGPQSGDLASYGIPAKEAAEVVVKEVNAKGGVLGRQIELVVEDDVCKPEIATNVATKLASEKVVAVLGHICSGATKAALGIYKDAKIVALSPSATNPELTQSGQYPNFFRTIASDDKQADVGVEFSLGRLHAKKIAVIHDKGDYGKGYAEAARALLEKQGKAKVVLFEGITPGAVDYSAIVQKIKQSGAEVVIYGGYHPEASKIVSQMKKKKMSTAFVSDDGVRDDTFIKVAGKDAEGVYASGPPVAEKIAAAYKKAHGKEPGAFYSQAYAGTLALVNAIKQAGSTDYDALVKALQTKQADTPLGKIMFDKRGDAIGVGFAMYQVKNGKYVQVTDR